jgi:hypothetical protein
VHARAHMHTCTAAAAAAAQHSTLHTHSTQHTAQHSSSERNPRRRGGSIYIHTSPITPLVCVACVRLRCGRHRVVGELSRVAAPHPPRPRRPRGVACVQDIVALHGAENVAGVIVEREYRD